jgi:hypothetical protein
MDRPLSIFAVPRLVTSPQRAVSASRICMSFCDSDSWRNIAHALLSHTGVVVDYRHYCNSGKVKMMAAEEIGTCTLPLSLTVCAII